MSDHDLVGKFRVTLNESERESLLGLIKKGKVAARKIVRARILLVKIKGDVEKQMIEIAKSSPPQGRSHWCVQMINQKVEVLVS